MWNKILCMLIGHKWWVPNIRNGDLEIIGQLAICKRCIKTKNVVYSDYPTGSDNKR